MFFLSVYRSTRGQSRLCKRRMANEVLDGTTVKQTVRKGCASMPNEVLLLFASVRAPVSWTSMSKIPIAATVNLGQPGLCGGQRFGFLKSIFTTNEALCSGRGFIRNG